MAPSQASRKREGAKPRKTSRPRPVFESPDTVFPSSKKDKRTIKHSVFVNKITKTHNKPLKRRRPNKKLVANLESLAEALPDLAEDEDGGSTTIGMAKIRHKSLKSRPGAMKRKEKIEQLERERFGKNLAQMMGSTPSQQDNAKPATIADRWSALKSFVQSTTEVKPEFGKT
ncbi:hypothetical protein BU16DRAFT_513606 [Lophium mytilinum]|uniref:Ribosome biogenesis protein SLX9 n=1 Tax=Lophium mytilinum TaxID=390894 RepID=A0A6A6QMG4_9PEZI|nr:hypothetical protein BU16DRAFT_513606 [Lophium mytilinum]